MTSLFLHFNPAVDPWGMSCQCLQPTWIQHLRNICSVPAKYRLWPSSSSLLWSHRELSFYVGTTWKFRGDKVPQEQPLSKEGWKFQVPHSATGWFWAVFNLVPQSIPRNEPLLGYSAFYCSLCWLFLLPGVIFPTPSFCLPGLPPK